MQSLGTTMTSKPNFYYILYYISLQILPKDAIIWQLCWGGGGGGGYDCLNKPKVISVANTNSEAKGGPSSKLAHFLTNSDKSPNWKNRQAYTLQAVPTNRNEPKHTTIYVSNVNWTVIPVPGSLKKDSDKTRSIYILTSYKHLSANPKRNCDIICGRRINAMARTTSFFLCAFVLFGTLALIQVRSIIF